LQNKIIAFTGKPDNCRDPMAELLDLLPHDLDALN